MTDFVEANRTSIQMTDGAVKAASDLKKFKQDYKEGPHKVPKQPKRAQIRSFAKSTQKIEEAWLR